MNKAYKYRLYPDGDQKILFAKTFGSKRFVYNYYLKKSEMDYKNGGHYCGKFNNNNDCNQNLKGQFPWLREVDKFALTNGIYSLDNAFTKFFSKEGSYPNFKKKDSRQSYTTNSNGHNIFVAGNSIQLPKLGKIRAEIHRAAPMGYKLKSATVSMERDGTYYCSVLYEYEHVPTHIIVPVLETTIGLDYKSDGLYSDSKGCIAEMPHYYRLAEKRLARAGRRLSKKNKGSKNREKAKYRMAKLSRHVANQRKDYLDKKSKYLADSYSLVCIEDLNMRGMSRSLKLGKSTLDNGWGMFTKMLEYKLYDRGKELIKVNKFYPSSQLCQCGYQNPITKDMHVRTITCPVCGKTYDRDTNAAINIKKEGYRLYLSEHPIAI